MSGCSPQSVCVRNMREYHHYLISKGEKCTKGRNYNLQARVGRCGSAAERDGWICLFVGWLVWRFERRKLIPLCLCATLCLNQPSQSESGLVNNIPRDGENEQELPARRCREGRMRLGTQKDSHPCRFAAPRRLPRLLVAYESTPSTNSLWYTKHLLCKLSKCWQCNNMYI